MEITITFVVEVDSRDDLMEQIEQHNMGLGSFHCLSYGRRRDRAILDAINRRSFPLVVATYGSHIGKVSPWTTSATRLLVCPSLDEGSS